MTVVTSAVQVTRTPLAPTLPLGWFSPTLGRVYRFVKCAELVIDDLLPGDLVHVDAMGQASTVPGVGNCMHARYVKATATTSIDQYEGILVCRAMGTNVDEGRHHSPLSCSGSFVAPAAGPMRVMFVMYAASLTNSKTTLSLAVNYVDLQATVTRYRPDPVPVALATVLPFPAVAA